MTAEVSCAANSIAFPKSNSVQEADDRMKPRKILLNLSGPYAVGKDTMLNGLLERYGSFLHRVRTITTRPVSADSDPSYESLSDEEFRERISRGRWIVNRQLSGKV